MKSTQSIETQELMNIIKKKVKIKQTVHKNKICLSYLRRKNSYIKEFIILKKNRINHSEILSFLNHCLPQIDFTDVSLNQIQKINEELFKYSYVS